MRPTSNQSFAFTARGRRAGSACASGRSRLLLLAVRSDELAHAVGLLRAFADPVVHPGQIQSELRLATSRDGVEETHLLEARTALPLAAIRHDDMIEGLVAASAPRETYGYHGSLKSVTGSKKSADSTQSALPAEAHVFACPTARREEPQPG